MRDVFDGHRERLAALNSRVRLHPGQVGALVAIGGSFEVLDHVSLPEVFATLHGPLVKGYALDALDRPKAEPPASAAAEAFLQRVLGAPVTEHDGIGLGRDVRFTRAGVGGAGLVSGTELVQLTAFGESGPEGRTGRIKRPSRRRR